MSEREHAPYGVYHYAGAGEASWFEFATAIIDLAGKRLSRPPEVLPIPTRIIQHRRFVLRYPIGLRFG